MTEDQNNPQEDTTTSVDAGAVIEALLDQIAAQARQAALQAALQTAKARE